MNVYIGLYGLQIFRDFRSIINSIVGAHKKKSILFLSHLAGKLQLSVEMLYDILGNSSTESDDTVKDLIFSKKINIVVIIEAMTTLLKLKEFKNLRESGIDNFIHKSIYYKEVLGLEEEEAERVETSKTEQSEEQVNSNNNGDTNNTTIDNSIDPSTEQTIDGRELRSLLEVKSLRSNKGYKKLELEEKTLSKFSLPQKIVDILKENTQTQSLLSSGEPINTATVNDSDTLTNNKSTITETKTTTSRILYDNVTPDLEKSKISDVPQPQNSNTNSILRIFNSSSVQTKKEHSSTKKTYSSALSFILSLFNNKSSVIELVYIIKPLVYLLAMRKLGRKSFLALLINAVLDYVSLIKKGSSVSKGREDRSSDMNSNSNDTEEKESFSQKYLFNKEYQRRFTSALSTYLIRQPILDYFTKPLIRKVLGFIRIVPESLINLIIRFLDSMYLYHVVSN